jgi:hypothetical protein
VILSVGWYATLPWNVNPPSELFGLRASSRPSVASSLRNASESVLGERSPCQRRSPET